MAHRDGGGFDRLIVMISGAQERDERAARVLGTESNIAVARKDGFDTICPSRGRHHLERVAFGMKEISSWRDARELDVPIEPWGDAGVDARARHAKDGRGLVRAWLAQVELVNAVGFAL